MPQRNAQNQGFGKSRTESKKEDEKRGGKSSDTSRARARMASEQPTYEGLSDNRVSAEKAEHRADTSRMGKRARGGLTGTAERSPDIDEGPSRGESRGIADDSGGALSQEDTEGVGRTQRGSARGRAQDTPEVNQAGLSKPSSERSDEDAGRGTAPKGVSTRGQSGGRTQEPTARGGFIEPDERTSGSSRRH